MCPVYHPGKPKRGGDRLKLATFRVKAFLWTEKDEGPFEGFGFAADISDKGMGIYLDKSFAKGAAVRIALDDENAEPYRGTVAWCQRYALRQQFQGHSTLDHRVGVHLRFESESDRQRFLMFFNDLKKRATTIKGGMKL